MSPSERTPLLKRGATPLPRLQLGILLVIRLTEPVAFFSTVPYLPALVLDHGAVTDPRHAGYAVGLIESLFAVAQLTTCYALGGLSDRIGRKPVIALSQVGIAICLLGFGFSSTFAEIVLWRCLMGAANGAAGVSRAAVAELTDASNEARAFSLLPVAWSVGCLLGTFLGGALARPVERGLMNLAVLRAYPYALPCIASSLVPVLGVISMAFYKEVR